jgi:hypothetical protein
MQGAGARRAPDDGVSGRRRCQAAEPEVLEPPVDPEPDDDPEDSEDPEEVEGVDVLDDSDVEGVDEEDEASEAPLVDGTVADEPERLSVR